MDHDWEPKGRPQMFGAPRPVRPIHGPRKGPTATSVPTATAPTCMTVPPGPMLMARPKRCWIPPTPPPPPLPRLTFPTDREHLWEEHDTWRPASFTAYPDPQYQCTPPQRSCGFHKAEPTEEELQDLLLVSIPRADQFRYLRKARGEAQEGMQSILQGTAPKSSPPQKYEDRPEIGRSDPYQP